MKRLPLLFLAAALIGPLPLSAQTLYTCGQGTVRNVQSVTEIVSSQAQIHDGDSETSYIVTVQLNDVIYTGRSRADVPWNFDPTRLRPNQQISVCANNAQIVLDRLDGTDYRASVVRVTIQPRVETRSVSEDEHTQLARR